MRTEAGRVIARGGLAWIALGLVANAQMHKVAQPEDVVRAVGVYEWTGDRAKPTASRLIPVTVFINGSLEDAGVYLARPVPFALENGTIYEVDQAGKAEGTVDLSYASHLRSPDPANNYDDGWFGYGHFAPPPAPKKTVALKESKAPAKIVGGVDESDRPTFVRRQGSSGDSAGSGSTTAAHGSGGAGSSDGGKSSPAPADDPDRPHLTKRADSSAPTDSSADKTAPTSTDKTAPPTTSTDKTTDSASTSTGSVPANDPDRPTLKKRTPEEAKKARKEAEQSSASGLATSLNDDPNRPTLHHGKGQQAVIEIDFPKLKGIPPDLHQAVAVSDAKTRPVHDYSRPWADDAERATILAKIQTIAAAQIAAYNSKNPAAAPVAAKSAGAGTARTASASPTPNSKLRHAKTPGSLPAANPAGLQNESLTGYTLSYGGAATYVYTAQTRGDNASRDYVTIVAQMNALGELQPAIQSVTDGAHLDRTPWMRLVDVVDADASNRASLLFELREQTSRQFALYRVIAARSEQVFLTGTTQ